MTSDEPGISVSAPATKPPVQDSAVAIVSLRIRQRSSSERERGRASLPLISIAPGQADGGARRGGDAFLATGESEPFAGRRFHGYPRNVQSGDLRDARTHGIPQWSDLRTLTDQGDFEMGDASAARTDTIDRIFEKLVGRSALPLDVAGRKMRADIAIRQRAEDGVDQRMKADIATGGREKTTAMGHANPANHQMIAVAEGVNVIAGPGPDVAEHGAEAGFFADEIFRSRELHVYMIAFKCCHRQSRQ